MNTTLELNTGQRFVGKSFGKEINDDIFSEIVFVVEKIFVFSPYVHSTTKTSLIFVILK